MIPMPSAELIERYNRATPRYTSYPAATEWTGEFTAATLDERLIAADRAPGPLSLYVHIPFCAEMCRFCGCNVIATKDRGRADEYLDVLENEVSLWAARLPHRRAVSQLHLGGGTPTFLSPDQLRRLVSILKRHFMLAPDAEVALEADPAITTPMQLETLASFGFNRLSVGVQDFDPTVQDAINRCQSADETEELVGAARSFGFKSVNIDLIYGLPHQTPTSFERTVSRVLDMMPDRLALFGYAHVPWAKPHQKLLPEAFLPGPLQRVEIFVQAARRLEAAGFRQLGLDHFARAGDPLARAQVDGTLTRNFQGYTTQAAPDTIAFGMSAISDIAGAHVQSRHRLAQWAEAVGKGQLPLERGYVRTNDDELRGDAIRIVMCLLRFDLAPLAATFGAVANAMYDQVKPGLEPLAKDGLLAFRSGGFDVTPLGRLFLRNIAAAFDAHLDPKAEPGKFSKAV